MLLERLISCSKMQYSYLCVSRFIRFPLFLTHRFEIGKKPKKIRTHSEREVQYLNEFDMICHIMVPDKNFGMKGVGN